MKIKYVNGLKIRNSLDLDFGVIGSMKIYSYIPKNKIWFDKYYIKEKNHFLEVHLYELKLMKKMSYEQARKIIEQEWKKKNKNRKKIPNFVVKTRRYKGFIIKYVDGRIIRKFLDPKFILGCHSIESKKTKKKEIWIDIRQDKKEYKYTLIHEYEEAKLMMEGMNYNNAHDYALVAEKIARRKNGARYLKD